MRDRNLEASLSRDEADTMSSFYALISRYFSFDDMIYGHDIKNLIGEVTRSALYIQKGAQQRDIELYLVKKTRDDLLEYEKRLEKSWGEIARKFSGLKRLE